ncbi:hypothetical protein Y032_0002g554 [Ancylostoma ceylanicum]|uniref:Secreted protein n=1 Tax=Ancylostoma ceylanicum TaxID=53326 RepID=A0A016W208_9BILA|nr:hypothetical protein Y032_0002g554 [Ancylostoma ceylanicum]
MIERILTWKVFFCGFLHAVAQFKTIADSPREIIVAARRAPVRLLINKPYSSGVGNAVTVESTSSSSTNEAPCPAPKRNRCNSWRPCLDLEKMIKNRISSESPRSIANKKD